MIKALSVVIACVIALASAVVLVAQSERAQSMRHKSKLGEVNDFAFEARGNNVVAVRKLTDQIVDRVAPFEVPAAHSLRARVFRAEHDFRRGRHAGIREGDLANAINGLVDDLYGPAWAKTNSSQLHLFRTVLKPQAPQLVGTKRGPRGRFDISDEMSPSEGMLVGLLLGSGKLKDPEYQIEPDEWVARVLAEKERRAQERRTSDAPRAILVGRIETTEAVSLSDSITHGLKDERSEISSHAHTFLDRLGIPR
jgi:hypothetical protein